MALGIVRDAAPAGMFDGVRPGDVPVLRAGRTFPGRGRVPGGRAVMGGGLYVPERDVKALYRDRSVALVGNAASITGTGYGPEINAHDVVVRCNFGAPVPPAMRADVGARTDVLYSVLLRSGKPLVDGRDVALWREERVGVVVSTHPRRHIRTRLLQQDAATVGQRWSAVEDGCRPDLRKALGGATIPNTGFIAMEHILRGGPARVAVYGFDFYRTGHWLGQVRESPEQAAEQAGGAPGHDQDAHRALFVSSYVGRVRLRPGLVGPAALDRHRPAHL
jgi:hypothetical protein